MHPATLRAQIEATIPSAFVCYRRAEQETMPTGISQIDHATGGVPLRALTELCGSHLASSGKTSVLVSLLAQASREHFCALVDATDAFDPSTAEAAGVNLSRLCWVRCGKSKVRLRPLEQAFKAADLLLQNGGFGLIAVDLSGIPERFVAKVPMLTWFRFSRVIEKQSAALIFIEREPHATSCAGLVLRMRAEAAAFSGNVLTQFHLRAEPFRTRDRKPSCSQTLDFSLKTQWA